MDLGEWTTASINLLNSNFGANIGAEYQPSTSQPPLWKVTPYAKTTNNGNVLTPDTLTLPGWSGSNQIPLTVTGNTVTVDFQPIGANMTCQLAYRTTTGKAVYSEFVSKGNCTLNLNEAPDKGVVIAVITNTDYIYKGEATRKAKFNYKLGLVTGVTGAASINTKWYESAKLRNLNTVTFTGTIVGNGGSISPEISGFLVGDTATITAYPKEGYTFVGWTGDVTSTATTIKIVMNANKKVTATFAAGPTYKLTSSVVGSGSVDPATGDYPQNSTQKLTAKPASGFIFTGWSGDVTGTTNPISVTLNSNKTVTATFAAIPLQTITYNVQMLPKTDYTPTAVALNASSQLAQFFGLTAAQISTGFTNKTIKFFGVHLDGSLDSVSTANAPGHWFDKAGEITDFGTTPYLYSEVNMNTLTTNIGQSPNVAKVGDVMTFKQAFVYIKSASDVNKITLVFNVSIKSVLTGLDELEENAEIKLFPNPFNSSFQIQAKGVFTYSIFDSKGIEIEKGIAASDEKLGSNLSKGLYLLKINQVGVEKMFKVIKE